MRRRRISRLAWVLWVAAGALAQEPDPGPAVPPGAAVERAAALLRAGRPGAAREILLEVVARAPSHGGARVLLGRIDLERGDLDSARRHLEIGALARPPRPALAWHLLARVRLLQGEAEPALEAWDRSLELTPRFGPALFGRARAALRLGALDRATADLERALDLDPHDPGGWLLLAEIHLLADRTDEAAKLLDRVAALPDASTDDRLAAALLKLSTDPSPDLAALRAAVGHHPHLPHVLLALGFAHQRAGQTALARNALRAALAADAENPVPWLLLGRLGEGTEEPYPRAYPALPRELDRARRLAEAEDPAAEAALAAILERRPNHLAARLLAARAAEQRDDPTGEGRWRALSAYRELLESFPATPAIEAAAARTARAMGALELAGCLADRAVRALPDDAATLYLLAVIQADAGRYDEAADSCRRAIDLGLDEAPVHVTLGFVEFERMNVAASIGAYSRALTLDPRAAGSIPRFALAALPSEEFGALRDLLEAHLRDDPDHREALYGLGVLSLRENDLARARGYFERLATLTPDDPQVHYNLGSIHLRQGDRERGAAAMESFRRLEAIEADRWLEHNRAHAERQKALAAAAAGELERAIEIYDRLAAAGTADQEDYLAAGRLCLELGDAWRAAGWFQGLLAVAPHRREALLGLAAASERLGRDDEARRARQRAELLRPDCEPTG